MKGNRMKLLALVVSFFMLVGCATSYQKSGFSGGYSETQLAENMFRVNFSGNGKTKLTRTIDFALLRSAELTLEHGYKYFVLVDESSNVSNTQITTSVKTRTTGNISGNSFTANSTSTGGDIINIRKPSSNNTILCFKEKPDQFSYDAKFIFQSIRTKYAIKNSNSQRTLESDLFGIYNAGKEKLNEMVK